MRNIIALLLILSAFGAFAQEDIIPVTRSVNIHQNDSLIEASIFVRKQTDQTLSNAKLYYWYAFDKIFQNQGAYSGYLLHGDYKVFDKEYHLIEKGQFKMGLKVGSWLQWDKSGLIKCETIWDDGIKDGINKYYKKGVLIKTEEYKDDKLDGKTIFYVEGKKTEVLNYKEGVLRNPPPVKKVKPAKVKKEKKTDQQPSKREQKKALKKEKLEAPVVTEPEVKTE